MKIHKVYTEELEIEYLSDFDGIIACVDSNHDICESPDQVQVTINDDEVTCKRCLKIMRKK